MNELAEYYGSDTASKTYKWGVVIPMSERCRPSEMWQAVAWFKTRRAAERYAKTGWPRHAIARSNVERWP